jgi:hypothetical protein
MLRCGRSRSCAPGPSIYVIVFFAQATSAARCDRLPAEMELLCWQLLHSPACCKPDNLRRSKMLVSVPSGDPDDPHIEAHDYCELDGDGSLDHLYHHCIKNTLE